jgi:hypothetical protein
MIEKHENNKWTHEIKTVYFSSREIKKYAVVNLSGQQRNRAVLWRNKVINRFCQADGA